MHRVALMMHDTTMLYEVAIATEVFGVDRADLSPTGEWYELIVCTADGKPHPWVPTESTADYSAAANCDSIIVPSTADTSADASEYLIATLREAHRQGVRIAALCTGAFVLAAAGLLDGRVATTHWMHADDLAARYPLIDVSASMLYADNGDIVTSAGKTAALDLCLHLVGRDFGAAAANGLSRRLVAPAQRSGGQAQYMIRPHPGGESAGLATALDWARANLEDVITVGDMARRASLSSRQFTRRMKTETLSTPLAWLHQQRIARARELLESTGVSVERIAQLCGMGTATTLRRHFHQAVGVSPTVYRASFTPAAPNDQP
ncbi:MAG: helix-turn-helix domain-containing protein [Microcella sp.]|uniref:GlxA family transcriptional regulator n=1 Tax=Microcella sp. TaxID=1913979 RepID=UPI0024CC0067|nr:helix-turn-helix domain-containing protein [Microcella sp.]UYN84455.1 MAG: helix-turn-helix domain-containing protein [Microcella sp.]